MRRHPLLAAFFLAALVSATFACDLAASRSTTTQPAGAPVQVQPWPRESDDAREQKPQPPPLELLRFISEYGSETEPVYVFERDGNLWLLIDRGNACRLTADRGDALRFAVDTTCAFRAVVFTRGPGGDVVAGVELDGRIYNRRQVGPADGSGQLRIEPVRPVGAILEEAMAASPPAESGTFRQTDLVELPTLDAGIRLDVRYATTNNFLGAVFYAEPRAFLQRPAAEAAVRAHRALQAHGYGLLVHDGYRPWFVTKTFWEATPESTRWLVADPSRGSRHNRGAAVDLTLYEAASGRVIDMPSTYDESTPRAFAFYPGGTHLQRWHRALLRRAMEAEGFIVNPEEWWHFDYKDAGSYRIGNVAFDKIESFDRRLMNR